jgi:hypothetical protein
VASAVAAADAQNRRRDRRHGHLRTLAERLGDVGLRLFEHAPLADGLRRLGGLRADPPTLAGRQRGGNSSFAPRASLAHRGDPSPVSKSPTSSSKSPWRATAGVLWKEFRGRLTDRRLQRLTTTDFETAPKRPQCRITTGVWVPRDTGGNESRTRRFVRPIGSGARQCPIPWGSGHSAPRRARLLASVPLADVSRVAIYALASWDASSARRWAELPVFGRGGRLA